MSSNPLPAVLIAGCGGPDSGAPTDPDTGVLHVGVLTTGQNPDSDGYSLRLDGTVNRGIEANGTLTFDGLAAGDHTLELSGEAPNCAVAGENPRSITLLAGGRAQESFEIDCFLLSGELLVQSARSGAWHLYRMQADGTGVTDLTPDTETFEGDWSADGQHIVYTEIRDARSLIGVMNRDGSNRRLLGVEGEAPKWSPDGSKIVFDSAFQSIRVMNVDGTNVVTLGAGRSPDWSPDGARIVFSRQKAGQSWGEDIWTVAADGSQERQLTINSTASSSLPAWSPDGRTIAFARRYYYFGPNGLYLMNADGSETRRISSIVPYFPMLWSPDGMQIATAVWNGDDTSGLAQDVTVIPSTGGTALVVGSSVGPDYPTSWR